MRDRSLAASSPFETVLRRVDGLGLPWADDPGRGEGMRERVIEVVDKHGALLRARMTFAVLGREVLWSAEIPGATLSVPLTGTAGNEESIAASLQAAVLRWGITASSPGRFS